MLNGFEYMFKMVDNLIWSFLEDKGRNRISYNV